MNIEQARKLFPGLQDKVFLDAACVSLTPTPVADAIRDFVDMTLHCYEADASLHHIAMDMKRLEAVEEAAKLFRVKQKQIALIESTTHGLNIAAAVLPLKKGDKVLIADTEYLQVAIPWSKRVETEGLEIVPVSSENNGFYTIDDFSKAIDEQTRVICVSSVQWCTGFRIDMKALGELCREKGIWLVVDGIQEAGVMDVNLAQTYADFYIAGGHKWFNSPFGCGLMIISERVLNECPPRDYGYLALEEPAGGWGEYFRNPNITPYREYKFPKVAKSYEIAGTSNYPGAIALGKSIKLVNEIGIDKIDVHVRKLTDLLHGLLKETPARLISSAEMAHRSGITILNWEADRNADLELLNRVLAEKIYISMRYTSGIGGIRISTHYYNNEEDIHRLVDTLKSKSTLK